MITLHIFSTCVYKASFHGMKFLQIMSVFKSFGVEAGQCWCTPLTPAFRRQRQEDLRVWGQSHLQSGFQDSKGYTDKYCIPPPPPPVPKKKFWIWNISDWVFWTRILKPVLQIVILSSILALDKYTKEPSVCIAGSQWLPWGGGGKAWHQWHRYWESGLQQTHLFSNGSARL